MIQGDVQNRDGMTGPFKSLYKITIVRAKGLNGDLGHTHSGLPGNGKGVAFNDFANSRNGCPFPTAMTCQSCGNRLSRDNLICNFSHIYRGRYEDSIGV